MSEATTSIDAMRSLPLSPSTRAKIRWNDIMKEIPATALSSPLEATAMPPEERPTEIGPTAAQTEQMIDAVAREFDRVVTDTTKQTRLFVTIAVGALLATVVGIAIYTFVRANLWGVTLNLAGVGGMFYSMRKAQGLMFDIALLRLTPQKYRFALTYAATVEERKHLIDRMLEELQPRR